MPYFLLSVCGFILTMVGVGLIRILRGPTNADRMMATQLFGTGGIAALLLLAAAVDVSAERMSPWC
jgi:multicomponent Na+:H+ antiporter subunit F